MMLQQGPSPTAEGGSSGGGGGGEEAERNSGGGGNRWPRQETIALLKIRSDMDSQFRDSNLKGPLWEEVSRKLAELGYQRSAKKCKEKFENVYKYHRRTKDGRTSKSDGKTYRFFDQLEALETNPPPALTKSQGSSMAVPMPHSTNHTSLSILPCVTVPLNKDPSGNFVNPSPPTPQQMPTITTTTTAAAAATAANVSSPFQNIGISPGLLSNSSSSETSSDYEPERRRKRKRKWKDFFGRLTKEVVQKQEEQQRKFLEALEKRERDRMMREEAWRMEEMAKMNREHDLLVQERSITAAKDAAVIAFLQKLTDQQNPPQILTGPHMQIQLSENPLTAPPLPPPPQPQQQEYQLLQPIRPQLQPPAPQPHLQNQTPQEQANDARNGLGEVTTSPSPSRWPKAEVQALIRLRTTLDMKYQENAPKGPLWEEISSAMRKLGYNRNAKRCKEKWENINKYYKKVKESNKKRPEDAKTCPYFHQLEQIYKERAKASEGKSVIPVNPGLGTSKPNNSPAPIMAQPEQQWPGSQEHEDNNEQEFSEEDEDDEDEVDGYEVVTNKPSSMGTVE